MRIIFLGDSLTQGQYGGDFVAEIDRMMPDDEIINAGIGGSTVLNLLDRIDDVIEQEPDGVFIMVGGNDSISYTQPATRPYYSKSQNVPDGVVTPDMFAQAYREILSRLQINHIQVWVGLPPKEYSPKTVASQKNYNCIAADVARSMNIPVLDLMAHFEPLNVKERPPIDIDMIITIGERSASGWDNYEAERERHGFTYSFDGIHITPETAREFAHLIHKFITA
ncbi:MAG: SGNH/GDSL hydrolase family protein [Chloroflexota bacterium]